MKDKELREAIKLGIRTLIIQEVRLLRLEHSFTPPIIIDEMSQSIRGTKREIAKLAKAIAQKERAVLLKRMIRQAVDEEIDRAIQLRKTKCIRCLHGRFYDEEGTAHANLPLGSTGLKPSAVISSGQASEKVAGDLLENPMTVSFETISTR